MYQPFDSTAHVASIIQLSCQTQRNVALPNTPSTQVTTGASSDKPVKAKSSQTPIGTLKENIKDAKRVATDVVERRTKMAKKRALIVLDEKDKESEKTTYIGVDEKNNTSSNGPIPNSETLTCRVPSPELKAL